VDIRSLYRHEHLAPETLIKGLYRIVAEKSASQDELFTVNELFGNAIGHEELDKVTDYYKWTDGWTNRLIQGDSLLVMTSLLEREGMAGHVQCIYLDPPSGIKYGSNWQIKLNNHTVMDGQDDSLSGEPEQIKAFRDTWELGIHSYLSYLRDRLLVAKQLLHESGSCFVQISDQNVHLVRCLMDEVFRSENFVALISFKKTTGQTSEYLPGTSDYALWYARDITRLKFRPLYKEREIGGEGAEAYTSVQLEDGTIRGFTPEEFANPQVIPNKARVFRYQILQSQREGRPSGPGSAMYFEVEFQGRTFVPSGSRGWTTTRQGLEKLNVAGRLGIQGNSLSYIRYLDDFPAVPLNNLWNDTQSGSGMEKIYVVQTNAKVIQRCILMTTDPGDLVLDPTGGSGTTAYVAEQWGRRWITTDTSRIALNIAKTRLMTATFPYYQLYDQQGHDLRQGFIYKKVPHITLGSIANNEPPEEETLYDQPQEDKKRLRVAGPFTVETLQSYEPISPEELARQREQDAELGNFENLIFEHLKTAGVKTGDKKENAVFVRLDRLSSSALHAEGWFGPSTINSQPSTPSAERKAYLHIGPKFGTVSKQAVTEAIKACRDKRDADWLLILGFAFESGMAELSRNFGNFQVSIVRMHDDLLQQGLLKRDKKAASFVTIGEPDIRVASGEWTVDSRGKPVLNPYESAELSRLVGVAAIHEIGQGDLPGLRQLAEAGNLRPGQPGAPDGGVSAGQHRGGSGAKRDGGVPASVGLRVGIAGGIGDTAATGGGVPISANGAAPATVAGDWRDFADADRFDAVAALEKLSAAHYPLSTAHYALVRIAGLDIYDPITDEVKSRDVHDIAYWMLDDDYDGSNFVVRQVFFCGGDKDEFEEWRKGLSDLAKAAAKRKAEQTLKIEMDDEAFARVYGHESHPFAVKKGQKIAVRVLSQFGEETTKVLEVK
jgi:adenine-specific DNA-methyltransferase